MSEFQRVLLGQFFLGLNCYDTSHLFTALVNWNSNILVISPAIYLLLRLWLKALYKYHFLQIVFLHIFVVFLVFFIWYFYIFSFLCLFSIFYIVPIVFHSLPLGRKVCHFMGGDMEGRGKKNWWLMVTGVEGDPKNVIYVMPWFLNGPYF